MCFFFAFYLVSVCVLFYQAKFYASTLIRLIDMLGKTSWYSIDVSGNDWHISVFYKKMSLLSLASFCQSRAVWHPSPTSSLQVLWTWHIQKAILTNENIPSSTVRAPVFGRYQFFGTLDHYGKAHGNLLSGWMNYNYTACCWFPTSSNILILPSQFWQIRFESYCLHCSKCRILVLLRYMQNITIENFKKNILRNCHGNYINFSFLQTFGIFHTTLMKIISVTLIVLAIHKLIYYSTQFLVYGTKRI